MRDPDWKSVSGYVDGLQSSGRYCFSGAEAAKAIGGSEVARKAALRRLKKKYRIVCPRRGFFVIVPMEHRSAGSPPASWFIDPFMAFLEQPYYVGLLTAAGIHGASHQQPQVFQVVTDAPTRPVRVGRVRIEFHRSRSISKAAAERVKTETGWMRVSTPEETALDLVRYPEACGHLDNVATVLKELAERIMPEKLVQSAREARHPHAQRLGYLLEKLGLKKLAEPLSELVGSRRRRPVLLSPHRGGDSLGHDPRWYVIPNEKITAEL